jgi:hypothetical protein
MMLQNPEVLANIQSNFSDIRPAQARPDTNKNVVTGTSVYGAYTPPSKDTSAPESPYLRTQADTGVSPFLASAFRNKPEMAQKKPDPIRQRELPEIKPIGLQRLRLPGQPPRHRASQGLAMVNERESRANAIYL